MTEQSARTDPLREAIRDLEASARQLDPGPEQSDELWQAVGGHVLRNVAERGHDPAYGGDGGLDPGSFAIAETPAPISEALATIGEIERSGINQASGGKFSYIPGGGLFPAALGDLLADVG